MNAPFAWPNRSLSSKLGRQARAVDGDERPAGAVAAAVDGPGQHALAGAALAAEQDRGLGRGDAERHVQRGPHRRLVRLQIGSGAASSTCSRRSATSARNPDTSCQRPSTTRSWSGVNGLGR